MSTQREPESKAKRLERLVNAVHSIVDRRRRVALESDQESLDGAIVDGIAELLMLDMRHACPEIKAEALATGRSALDVFRQDVARMHDSCAGGFDV